MNSQIIRLIPVAAAAAATAALVAACSSGSSGATTAMPAAGAPSGGSAGSRQFPPGGGSFGPATSGKIAAVSGKTMQVQSASSGQTAVTWTGSTTFTRTVDGKISAIRVGECVVASGSSSSSSNASGTAKVTSVHVAAANNGKCAGGFPGGTMPGSAPGGSAPSGFPSGARSGSFPRHAGGGTFVTGKVVSVSGSTIVVAAEQFGSSGSTTTKRTLNASGATVTTTRTASAKSVAVGMCATARGKAGSTGAVTATTIALSTPTNGQCQLGFGGAGR